MGAPGADSLPVLLQSPRLHCSAEAHQGVCPMSVQCCLSASCSSRGDHFVESQQGLYHTTTRDCRVKSQLWEHTGCVVSAAGLSFVHITIDYTFTFTGQTSVSNQPCILTLAACVHANVGCRCGNANQERLQIGARVQVFLLQ